MCMYELGALVKLSGFIIAVLIVQVLDLEILPNLNLLNLKIQNLIPNQIEPRALALLGPSLELHSPIKIVYSNP